MAEAEKKVESSAAAPAAASPAAPAPEAAKLGSATYEIIRQRLRAQGDALRERMAKLNARRQEVFGAVEFKLLQADRITTQHNCTPQDMVQLGRGRFLFGFNVSFGLKKEIELGDVFAIYTRDAETGTFKESDLEILKDKQFLSDFKRLYNVYEKTALAKFSLIEGSLYMVFSIGPGVNDISVFKWAFNGGQLKYIDGRSEAEFRKIGFPPPHEFRWVTPSREAFRYGDHPHISIDDRVFVECVGGDLTIKVEDNTATGEGIFSEPVSEKNQKVDDAEIAYATLEHLILLKVRPYKETEARFFIFNEKQQTAVRVDSIGQSCALLPAGHGLVFPDGYYLATGELKRFEGNDPGLVLERIIHAINGEDSLYVFYERKNGSYALMPYRLISQKVEERITCHGFSLFPDGHLLLFRADDEPQKHHMIQLRQTPFYTPGHEPEGKKDAFLYKVGNKDVVRALAEINETLTLVNKDNPYAELYADLVKRAETILDSYPWLASEDGFGINESLKAVREAADKAVDEFDKVRRLQREAELRVQDLRKRSGERVNTIRRASFKTLDDFVKNLAALRQLRGELITAKEAAYVNVAHVDEIEKDVVARTDELSRKAVEFLLQPAALDPYRKQADEHLKAVDQVAKVADGKKIDAAVREAGGELEMLIEIVNSLRIEDATEATRIIDSITAIYATLNQVKAALKNRLAHLVTAESAAQFSAQMKLLSQSAASYLDLCTTPAKCDEYLNRISVQLEELEGAFADFEEYTVQLAEKRTSLYEAFEQRKLALIEQRNRKASALMTAAERILKVIAQRLGGFKTIDEINAFVASDMMISKLREIVAQLLELGDSVKADDLQGRLKSTQQDAVRQLKDRQELFVGGSDVIQLGRRRFNMNTQPLDLTVVMRDGVPNLHLTSTKYFEPITDEAYLATRDVWEQEVVSENADVYRAEFLASRMLRWVDGAPGSNGTAHPSLAEAAAMREEEQLRLTQEFMGSRYAEGYTKGVHDLDGARIFRALAQTHLSLGLARYQPSARACAVIFWRRFCAEETRALWTAKLKGFSARNRLFPGEPAQADYIEALRGLVGEFIAQTRLFAPETGAAAGEYLFFELIAGDAFALSVEADRIVKEFKQQLVTKGSEGEFRSARESLAKYPVSEIELIRDWVRGFLLGRADAARYLDEVAALLFLGNDYKAAVAKVPSAQVVEGMRGSHARIREAKYNFDYIAFQERLAKYEREIVPRFEKFHAVKAALVERERAKLRLDEFKPKVLTSFVRNQLIDQVYLPMVGDNLAKQIGEAGEAKRTDLMGLLLLISPPGYGKTTLMEYVASRLGIIFVKINGPAIGHAVTSLDPEEAPNAAAREEVKKLNLSLEMGDNVMICIDDIQHCNPEFLQKFISLCDGQRRIEGVWRDKPRTYDLRGRKVVVVMAGNPYTESGQKFKVPDMLANRADTYNLGDIIGGSSEWFKASYIENAITSNTVLAPLANKSQKDIRVFIKMAETEDKSAEGLEGTYSSQEIEEILAVMKKLIAIRDVVLRVNMEYIHSAGQAEEFRTEPAFKLQGSYRNMNRLAEKVVAVMNDEEVRGLIVRHYQGESQTLTTGAEANLLKFKEMIGIQTPEEKARWEEIKKTFKRNQLSRGADGSDPIGRVVGQLSGFQEGLQSIGATLEKSLSRTPPPPPPPAPITVDLSALGDRLDALRTAIEKGAARSEPDGMGAKVASLSHELEMIHSTLATLKDVAAQQRDHLKNAQELLATRAKQGVVEIDLTQEMLTNERAFLERFQQVISQAQNPPPTDGK